MASKIDLLVRTLQLAAFGLGKVSPAPLVGWVLASADHIILAEGWLPQKPILPIISFLKNKISDTTFFKQSTLYVNILPTISAELMDFLSEYQVSKICVAGNIDFDNQTLSNNISLEDNFLLENELFLNRRFYVFSERKHPYIILKWAETADGFIARENYDSKWISSTQSRRLVHKWRAEEDAIMVGTNTAHYDNPKLNVRSWSGRNPIRIVIDKQLRLDPQLYLFDGSQPTLCYNLHRDQTKDKTHWVRISGPIDRLAFFTLMLQDIWQRNIQSVIIEGGSELLHFLIKHQLWDEARVFTSQKSFGKGLSAPILNQELLSETMYVDQDLLKVYRTARS